MNRAQSDSRGSSRIWWFAFGYFASYVPYTLFTKSLTSGEAAAIPWSGTAILPLSTAVSVAGMFIFISAMRWWSYAPSIQVGRVRLPRPRFVTFMSGIATSAIVLTTTLAYTFDGISVLFAMLLMRGGVLMLAPIVDRLTGRSFASIPWWSWAGSGLALVALIVGFAEDGGAELTLVAAIDIAVYLAAYFFRLRWMSVHAKTGADAANARERRIAFFVEEQMVATPLALIGLAILALAMPGVHGDALRQGFVEIWSHGDVLLIVCLIGVGSQGAGVFGALILLEPQENAYTVPVNRASSVLAGVVSSFLLMLLFGTEAPSGFELAGAGLVVLAIVVLSYPTLAGAMARRRGAGTPQPGSSVQ